MTFKLKLEKDKRVIHAYIKEEAFRKDYACYLKKRRKPSVYLKF
jgi:hypothetical protein